MRPFRNREDAGARLAQALKHHAGKGALVLGIPRGGVPVAAEVARVLDADLDVIVARKMGSPVSAELAMGAVTADGVRYVHEETLAEVGVSSAYLERVAREKAAEAREQELVLRAGRAPPTVAGRTVILVDDGLATGSTMIAAARSVRARHPKHLVVAVPVGAPSTCEAMRAEADEVVCLEQPEPFHAVGLHYLDFSQTEDEEVERLLGIP